MNSIIIRSPATSANVGPGYDIFALALKEPFDEIKLTLNDNDEMEILASGALRDIPLGITKNSAGLALLELFKRKGISRGFKIEIFKNMPSGGGLGTTGASASAAVFGANKLLNLKIK